LYGAGHAGRDIGCLTPLEALENRLITPAGAIGGFDPAGTPTTYRVAMEHIRDGRIDVEPLLTYRYTGLGQFPRAFRQDVEQENLIKSVLVRREVG